MLLIVHIKMVNFCEFHLGFQNKTNKQNPRKKPKRPETLDLPALGAGKPHPARI